MRMKNSGSTDGNRARCALRPCALQNRKYWELLSVWASARRLGGILPPLSVSNLSEMSWPDGRSLGRYPLTISARILSEYGCRTRPLLAFGQGVGPLPLN